MSLTNLNPIETYIVIYYIANILTMNLVKSYFMVYLYFFFLDEKYETLVPVLYFLINKRHVLYFCMHLFEFFWFRT